MSSHCDMIDATSETTDGSAATIHIQGGATRLRLHWFLQMLHPEHHWWFGEHESEDMFKDFQSKTTQHKVKWPTTITSTRHFAVLPWGWVSYTSL